VVVVGLDFGTTFSGYAYCHKDDPEKIFMFYEWPEQASGGGQPYCKTQTSLYYAADAQGKLQTRKLGLACVGGVPKGHVQGLAPQGRSLGHIVQAQLG
jgi:hypothetical protein